MRIRRLEIVAFGHWRNKTVTISPDMMVLYGDNEAGKSTLYHFIRTMLFGFSTRNKKTQLYKPHDTDQFGGRLWLTVPGYGDVKIERFEGSHKGKAKVYFEEGIEGDDQTLKELLAPLTSTLFDEIYSLDPEQLFQYKGLSEEALQRSLLSIGATGSHRLMQLADDYNKERQKLYKVKGRVPELNQQLETYRDLKRLIAQKEANEKNYRTLLTSEKQATKELQENQKKCQSVDESRQLISKQIKSYDLYKEYQSLLKDKLLMGFDFEESKKKDLQELLVRYEYLQDQKETYQSAQLALINQATVSPAVTFYIANESELEEASLHFSEVEQVLLKESWIRETITELEHDLKQVTEKLNQTVTINHAGTSRLKITEDAQKEIERVAEQEHDYEKLEVEWIQAVQEERSKENYYLAHLESEKAQLLKWLVAPIGILGIGFLLLILSYASVGVFFVLLGIVTIGLWSWRFMTTKQLLAVSKKRQLKEVLPEELVKRKENLEQIKQVLLYEKEQVARKYNLNVDQPAENWCNAIPLLVQEETLIQRIEDQQIELASLDDQFTRYQERMSFMKEWLPPHKFSKEKWLSELQRFYNEVGDKAKQQLELTQTGESVHQGLTLAELTQRETELKQNMLALSDGQLRTIEDVKLWLAESEEKKENDNRLYYLEQQLSGLYVGEINYSEEKLKESYSKLSQELEQLKLEQTMLSNKLQEYRFDLKQQESDGSLAVLYQEQSELESELTRLSEQWSTYKLGEEVVTQLLERLTSERLGNLLEYVSDILSELTDERYVTCLLSEGHLVICNQEGVCYHLDELSTGTRDQLILSVRLAFILSYQEEIKAPLIIDDAWLHYDQQRKIQLFNVLQKMSQANQVICLSSDQELMTYAEVNELKMDYL
ncbi:ATP-binding protein [Vagococcus fessus]|uniref:YhaN AAA domain-containing protein n=1 Tax=Vagococcus fessus TaxID=120370 RepID=A0A430A894_9ENTE|nr:AAA family ATPase [Vagococcus fessus]RSU03322.1 hypothetical protein CBF31_06295 [Vagococcus fessus]